VDALRDQTPVDNSDTLTTALRLSHCATANTSPPGSDSPAWGRCQSYSWLISRSEPLRTLHKSVKPRPKCSAESNSAGCNCTRVRPISCNVSQNLLPGPAYQARRTPAAPACLENSALASRESAALAQNSIAGGLADRQVREDHRLV
jgi:hypothetical protein